MPVSLWYSGFPPSPIDFIQENAMLVIYLDYCPMRIIANLQRLQAHQLSTNPDSKHSKAMEVNNFTRSLSKISTLLGLVLIVFSLSCFSSATPPLSALRLFFSSLSSRYRFSFPQTRC